jgi:hypothetical protein
VVAEDVATFGLQKLVDTTIVSDAIWYVTQDQPIAVMSDDEDVIPGLLVASALGGKVLWLGSETSPRPQYSSLLATHGVGYVQC